MLTDRFQRRSSTPNFFITIWEDEATDGRLHATAPRSNDFCASRSRLGNPFNLLIDVALSTFSNVLVVVATSTVFLF